MKYTSLKLNDRTATVGKRDDSREIIIIFDPEYVR